jgi:ABC-2 type transport system ATP-binding protein
MIQVRGLTHRYGPLTAIEDLSFTVGQGEVLGLLGPNGAGKTTTLRAVVGLLSPSAGSISIGAHDLAREPLQARRLLGFLPENVPLYRELTVTEFLRYASRAKGVPPAQRAAEIERVVHTCGLQSVTRRLIGFCSKGFRQRIGLAQALLGDPPVLVLDEPTVGLDPAQVVEIRTTVAALARQKALILSTHILPEASRLCTRVLILNRGHLVAEGSPDELERLLAGGARLRLVCGADDDAGAGAVAVRVESILRALPCVAGFTPAAADRGRWSWTVDLRAADDAPALVEELVRSGCRLHEFAPLRAGLEAVFLELVRREAQDDGGAYGAGGAHGEGRAGGDGTAHREATAHGEGAARPGAAASPDAPRQEAP